MTLSIGSNSFNDGNYLSPKHTLIAEYGFGCEGNNISPELHWSGAPEGTKSFALTCFDPDAPTGSGFWHWVVVNIPADMASIAEGSDGLSARALQTRTDFGKPGYGGPCPPGSDHPHRYVFTLHAVGVDSLPVEADTSAAVVGFMLHFNAIEKTTLMSFAKR